VVEIQRETDLLDKDAVNNSVYNILIQREKKRNGILSR